MVIHIHDLKAVRRSAFQSYHLEEVPFIREMISLVVEKIIVVGLGADKVVVGAMRRLIMVGADGTIIGAVARMITGVEAGTGTRAAEGGRVAGAAAGSPVAMGKEVSA